MTKTLSSKRFITRPLPLNCSRMSGFWDLKTVSGRTPYACFTCLYSVLLLQLNRDENAVKQTIYHKTPPSQLLADEWFLRSENGFCKNFLCLFCLLMFRNAASTKPWRKRCQANDLSQDPSLSTARGRMVFEIWQRFLVVFFMPVLSAYFSWCWCNQTATKT